jgi:hypothetical protein
LRQFFRTFSIHLQSTLAAAERGRCRIEEDVRAPTLKTNDEIARSDRADQEMDIALDQMIAARGRLRITGIML